MKISKTDGYVFTLIEVYIIGSSFGCFLCVYHRLMLLSPLSLFHQLNVQDSWTTLLILFGVIFMVTLAIIAAWSSIMDDDGVDDHFGVIYS